MKLTKKRKLIYLGGIVLAGLIYLSYPNKSEELIGIGLAIITLFILNILLNKKVKREVRQYARENISIYTEPKGSGGTNTGNLPGNTSTDSEGEPRNEEPNSNERHSDIQSEHSEIPELNENGVPESDSTDSDSVEEYSSAIPDLE